MLNKGRSFTVLHSESDICIYALVTSVDCIDNQREHAGSPAGIRGGIAGLS